jgi:hypothetical protein
VSTHTTLTGEAATIPFGQSAYRRRQPHRHARRIACLLACLAALAALPAAPAAEVTLPGARVEVDYAPGDFGERADLLLPWVRRSGEIVSAYYGHFPVSHLKLALQAQPGEGVHGGKTFANPDAYIRVGVGRAVTAAQLTSDWVLVHEMTHLALPDTGEEHAWLSEGLATYVEGIARVQAGNRTELDVWTEELSSMPRGLPQAGDAGLDHTHTWGRTYWGGAMFCLLADVEIHRRTHNAKGLQDALRAILAASGGLSADWPIGRVLARGDEAVGVPVLEELYARYRDAAAAPDLAQLWKDLGVESSPGGVHLNEAAPLADIRRAIMAPRSAR